MERKLFIPANLNQNWDPAQERKRKTQRVLIQESEKLRRERRIMIKGIR